MIFPLNLIIFILYFTWNANICFEITVQKIRFSSNDLISKYDHIRSVQRICSHLREKSLKLTSHGVLHYMCLADISKSFSRLFVSIFIWSHFFFNKFCPLEQCGVILLPYYISFFVKWVIWYLLLTAYWNISIFENRWLPITWNYKKI